MLPNTNLVDNHSKAEQFWGWLSVVYEKMLRTVLKNTISVVLLALSVVILSGYFFNKLPSELEPFEDNDFIFGWISFNNQVTDSVRTSWYKAIEQVANENVSEKERIMVGQWQNFSWWVIHLLPRNQRDQNADKIAQRLVEPLDKIPGPMIGVNVGGTSTNGNDALEVVVRYSGNNNYLLTKVRETIKELEKVDGISRVDSDEVKLQTRYRVTVLRDVTAKLGVHVAEVEKVLYTFFSGQKAAELDFDGFDYDIKVIADKDKRSDISSVNQFFVKTPQNVQVPLGSLVEIEEIALPAHIRHDERMRSVKISLYLEADFSMERALNSVKPILQANLPDESLISFRGTAEDYQRAKYAMALTLALALAFIYLILAALFESLIDPFIVLVTVPMSMLGAVLAIYITGGSNNIYFQIGLVTLIGLITKHGILITDFANRLRNDGMELSQAILQAAKARLRPIAMTTFAMVFGAIPLILSVGAGANARHHLGWVIIGGMLSGTLFSLFVIPVAYYLASRLRNLLYFFIIKGRPEHNM